ncbi:MAG: DUF6778 family protein [Paracoccaceae bacterium]
MKPLKMLMAVVLGTLVSGCSWVDTNSRAAAKDSAPRVLVVEETAPVQKASATDFRVEAVRVYVNPDLVVSERNSYYPGVDIVWREDPPGNRYQQVKDIFELAFARGSEGLDGTRAIELHVDVRRFHALTEKARFTVGGVHAITFALQKRDSVTGEAVGEVKVIRADLKAYGGQSALVAMRLGQTQKVRITDHLADVIRAELTSPNGYENVRLGPLQALNQL